ncbi:MAG: helix-turn-helix domain-containing protein [bacterium]|nr:helix-turn-helix domain-containing protein [bacterium]MDW8034658.1 helix-turn-helix transcriptional regulator [Nitrososphaerota archaeon]
MYIGDIIREKRERLGISRNKLAMMLGVNPMTIYAWEKGIRTPKAPTIKAIETILGKIEEEPAEKERMILEKLRKLRERTNLIDIDSSEVIREVRRERLKG